MPISAARSPTRCAAAFRSGLNSDPWQYSISRGDKLGKQSYVAGRMLLDWDNSNGVRLSLNVNGWRDTSDPQAQQLIAIRPTYSASPRPMFWQRRSRPPMPALRDWTASVLDPATGVVNPASGAVTPGTAQSVNFTPFSNRSMIQIAARRRRCH
jgi:hypothetical protein